MQLRTAAGLLLVGGLVAGAACSGSVTAACPSTLESVISPPDTVIHVGQQFTIHVSLLGCGGTKTLSDSITYSSANPATASVDPASGVVTGVAVGTTTITVVAHHYDVTEPVTVSVQ